ncbi:PREDICTED: uncharacterized protein LOC106747420 [Dinoponera quadriceps]|uniref:Uncharacterized protein LOC106747420 n=1 Tax=Dinoponera quadriceps TaxID=609295 RepID=A0A6P3XR53_DINQU|nr:PREDICTED: uncharacterized protein LOC106747420 [Dinoponera quadriceps]
MDYFHTCLENVRRLSVGKTKHLMLKALADTLGGYLRVYILPLTRHSYYAGNIKYRNAKMLFELFDELKTFLRTNGAGWSKPSQDVRNVQIPPITITPPKTSLACNGLITYSAPFERHSGDYRSFTFKKKKRSTVKRGNAKRAINGYNKETAADEIIIPLPFLDNEVEPNSIALPFKTDSLQSLYTEKSAFALVKYYIVSAKCIALRSNTRTQSQTFNKDFHSWLRQSVLRHLDDEKWYPAFGGVLRVMATLRESSEDMTKSKTSGAYQMMPKVTTGRKSHTDENLSSLYKGKGENDDSTKTLGTTEIVIIAVVSALALWLLVGLCLVCYRFLSKDPEKCSPCESKTAPFALLYKNTDYCEPDTCPSRSSRTGVVEKLKEWWRSRFGRCPGGCQKHEDEERCLAAINYCSRDTVGNSSRIYPWTYIWFPVSILSAS